MNHEDGREYVLGVTRELYGRTVYSHKTHEKEREIWEQKSLRDEPRKHRPYVRDHSVCHNFSGT